MKDIILGTNNRSVPHEFGHTGGLNDVNLNNSIGVKNMLSNLMTQGNYVYKHGGDSYYYNSIQLEHSQINAIWIYGKMGMLNRVPAVKSVSPTFINFPFNKKQFTR